jgi:hypothetical protein
VTTDAIKLTSPNELLAVIPFILGFRPENSVVTMCLTDNRLGLTQRLHLPRPQDAHHVASALMPSLMNESPDSVILIGYEARVGDSRPALDALTTALKSSAMRIHDRLVVSEGRWRSLDCNNATCCPQDGSPVPEPEDVPGVVAEFIGQGVAPQPDRAALARQLEAGPQAAAVADVLRSVEKDGDRQAVPRSEQFAAWPRILHAKTPSISVEDAALAAVSLLDIEIRDGLVAWLCPGTLHLDDLSDDIQKLLSGLGAGGDAEDIDPSSTEAQSAIQARLVGLCAMLPDQNAAPALSVLASFVWWRGDGALARVALARALRIDPGYRLAQLLEQMVDLAIRPGDH